jgi:EmrB/QacA subfamily drug resistance transporter
VIVFTGASILCGFAPSEAWLIIARGLQGLGAALISPAALSIVTTTFAEGKERTRAMGVWAAIAVGGGAVGLVLGGVLTETLSWPWIFFVNGPVGLGAFLLSLRLVPESKDEQPHKTFDLPGAITVTAGLLALVYGIVRSSDAGWGSFEVVGALTLATVLLIAFIVIEHFSAEPLVRLSIFLVRTVRGANVAMFIVAAGLFAMFFFNTLYLQRVLGYSPLEAGLAFLPFTAGIIIGAGLSQRLLPMLGAREVPLIGLALAATGVLTFVRLDADGASYAAELLPGIMLTSIGMGLTFVPVTLIATSGIPHGDAGLASGLFNTAQQIGGALGLAVLSTIATSRTTGVIEKLGRRPSDADTATALVDGFHLAWIGTATLLVCGALLLFALLRRRDVVAASHGEAVPVVA